jgi:hypothetical protein
VGAKGKSEVVEGGRIIERTMDTTWQLDMRMCTMSKGGLKFHFSRILRHGGVPLKWEEELTDGGIVAVTDAGRLRELNQAFSEKVAQFDPGQNPRTQR